MSNQKGCRRQKQKNILAIRLLCSYIGMILAPIIGLLVINFSMQKALYKIQQEKVKTSTKEVAITLNKDVEEAMNVARYIGENEELRRYFSEANISSKQKLYEAIRVIQRYPDYASLVRGIRKVHIYVEQNPYIISYPQIIPNTSQGRETIPCFYGENFQRLRKEAKKVPLEGLISYQGVDGHRYFLCLRHVTFAAGESGMVLVELDNSLIRSNLQLGKVTQEGSVLLTNHQNQVLLCTKQCAKKEQTTLKQEEQTLTRSCGELSKREELLKDNGWKVVSLSPKRELMLKEATKRNGFLAVCLMSILIGIAISIENWNRSRPVIEKYLDFQKRQKENYRQTDLDLWKGLSGVLSHTELLEERIEEQQKWAGEQMLKRALYGLYETPEQIKEDLATNGMDRLRLFPAFLFSLDFDRHGASENISWEELDTMLVNHLHECLEGSFEVVHMELNNWTVLEVEKAERTLDQRREKMEELLEWLLLEHHFNVTIACSETVHGFLDLSQEYEHIVRIREYAQYYKIRGPLWIVDLPHHQHVVFSVDLELQMERVIRSGNQKQLEELWRQIQLTYFHQSGGSRSIKDHTLEIVRCIILRCLEKQETKEGHQLLTQAKNVRTEEEMEMILFATSAYFKERKEQVLDAKEEELKKRLEENCLGHFRDAAFNLDSLASKVDMDEKKLYREFKKMFGVSFSVYVEMLRMNEAQQLLKEGRAVQEVSVSVGYSSDYSFRRAFKRVVGMTPSDFQEIHQEEE